MEYFLKDLEETRKWARDFAKTLHAPQTVALHGDLGMGKSEIAREIIKTLRGADTVVPSPTLHSFKIMMGFHILIYTE